MKLIEIQILVTGENGETAIQTISLSELKKLLGEVK
jgi:hypothetical protein